MDWILSQVHGNRDRAVKGYRKFVKAGVGINVWDGLRGGVILGTEQFVEELKPLLRKKTPEREIPREDRLVARPKLAELFGGTKDKADRNEQIYQTVRIYGYTLHEVADTLGLHYSTVSVIANRVAEAKKHQE